MATSNSPIQAAAKTRQWLRTGMWLFILAALFVAFAQFATGSALLWNDSTLLVAVGVLSVALFIALSRARAQGIDARRTFLNSVMTLLWFVLISELVFVLQPELHRQRIQRQFRYRSVPGSSRLAACRFCSAPFDDCSPAIFARSVFGLLQVGHVLRPARGCIHSAVSITNVFSRLGVQALSSRSCCCGLF